MIKSKIMNMTMVQDPETSKVLVLDKKIKYGWEGLTFCGGKVEAGESFYDSAKRELFEESGLRAENLDLVGFCLWYIEDRREVGILYKTKDFSGNLRESREGSLSWMDLNDLKKSPAKSQSMEEILNVYLNDDLQEVVIYYRNDKKVRVEYF